ncbi:MAG: helix-turn-helix domain-containing protein [Deltaproteobacteria bacterium]|jgi:predicted DNA-binding transcriptional regulator AlpA|nr:helix-turn-helix domain-containing protein [Deltaproteobacteria bacterium]
MSNNQTTNQTSNQFLNRSQAAEFLNLRKCTLEAWAIRGGGPAFVKFGRAVRYRISDLENYIKDRTRQNTISA